SGWVSPLTAARSLNGGFRADVPTTRTPAASTRRAPDRALSVPPRCHERARAAAGRILASLALAATLLTGCTQAAAPTAPAATVPPAATAVFTAAPARSAVTAWVPAPRTK